jgi:hypothetical protein
LAAVRNEEQPNGISIKSAAIVPKGVVNGFYDKMHDVSEEGIGGTHKPSSQVDKPREYQRKANTDLLDATNRGVDDSYVSTLVKKFMEKFKADPGEGAARARARHQPG